MRSRGESTRILLKSNDCQGEKTKSVRPVRKTQEGRLLCLLSCTWENWPHLYVLYCFAWPEVQEWLQCLLSGRPSCLLCCTPSPLYTSPRCPPCQTYCRETRESRLFSKQSHQQSKPRHLDKWADNDKTSCTHKAMRPSEARLNTTLPSAATPALWPCVREERVRGSRLPTRPVGERNSGEEQGPKADVLRLESIVRNRRAFTFPWRGGETEG